MGVFLQIVPRGRAVLTAANVLCRSVNYNNSNNFCLVNTDGNANNTNAYNSYGVAPGFRKPRVGLGQMQ